MYLAGLACHACAEDFFPRATLHLRPLQISIMYAQNSRGFAAIEQRFIQETLRLNDSRKSIECWGWKLLACKIEASEFISLCTAFSILAISPKITIT